MGAIVLRLLPVLLLIIALVVLITMAKRKQWNSPLLWAMLGLLAVSIIGGGLALFITDDFPKRPHSLSPTKYIDGKIVPGERE